MIGKSVVAAPRRQAAPAPVVAAVAARPSPAMMPEPPAAVAPPAPAKVEEPKPTEPPKADDAKAEPSIDERNADAAKPETAKADDKKADDPKADEAKGDEAKSAAADEPKAEANPKKLRQEALTLLNQGKRNDAIEKAKEAIAADPDEAIAYLYLGSALQDSGHWKEGIEAYSEACAPRRRAPCTSAAPWAGTSKSWRQAPPRGGAARPSTRITSCKSAHTSRFAAGWRSKYAGWNVGMTAPPLVEPPLAAKARDALARAEEALHGGRAERDDDLRLDQRELLVQVRHARAPSPRARACGCRAAGT